MALEYTALGTPAGVRIRNGHSTRFALANAPTISLWIVSLTPPGVEGGELIPTTTMHNTALRTMAAQSLKTMTPMTMRCAYNAAVIDNLFAQVNNEQSGTLHFSQSSGSWDFFCAITNFAPDEIVENAMPLASVTIGLTNTDPLTGAETSPDYRTASGTT